MAFQRKASAEWKGDLKTGKGTVASESGALKDVPYDFVSRFDTGGKFTNPEELIGAAHAGCFSMALSNALAKAGHVPTYVRTRATVTLSMEGGPHIQHVQLVTEGKVPGIDAATFEKFANEAKVGCPVSKALKSVEIAMDAKLAQ